MWCFNYIEKKVSSLESYVIINVFWPCVTFVLCSVLHISRFKILKSMLSSTWFGLIALIIGIIGRTQKHLWYALSTIGTKIRSALNTLALFWLIHPFAVAYHECTPKDTRSCNRYAVWFQCWNSTSTCVNHASSFFQADIFFR